MNIQDIVEDSVVRPMAKVTKVAVVVASVFGIGVLAVKVLTPKSVQIARSRKKALDILNQTSAQPSENKPQQLSQSNSGYLN